MRATENGGMIALPTKQDKAINILREKGSNFGFTAEEIRKKRPRLSIRNIPTDFFQNKDDLARIIALQNPDITATTNDPNPIKVVAIHKTKFDTVVSAIIEVLPSVRKVILKTQKIKLGMCLYTVSDHIHVIKC